MESLPAPTPESSTAVCLAGASEWLTSRPRGPTGPHVHILSRPTETGRVLGGTLKRRDEIILQARHPRATLPVCVCVGEGGGRCRLCCAGKGRRLSWPRRAVCFLLNDSLPLTWINRSRHELEGAVLIKTSKSRLWVRLREQEAQDATRARCSGRCGILQTEGRAQSTRSALHAIATSSHGAGLPACEPDWAADLPSHCPRRLVLSREKPPASKSQGTLLG